MPEGRQTSGPPWRRHDLLRVMPEVWAPVLSRCLSIADLPLVRNWADRGWPVIVRRRADTEEPGLVPIGLPLPPALGKRRLALLLSPDGISQHLSPPLLQAAASVADSGWRSTIDSLLALGARTGVEPSAFGSLMWQHQTGLPYVSTRSDLDVLWLVPSGFDVLSLVFSIAELQRGAAMPIDGEIVFRDGAAVSWRELWLARRAADRASVLVKTMEGVRLLDVASLPGVRQHA